MNVYAADWIYLLAASQEEFRVWGRFDHERAAFGPEQMLLVSGGFVLIVAAVLVWNRLTRRAQRTFTCNNSSRLFRELCRAHRLNGAARRLLKSLAAARELENPALVFVKPECFEPADLPPQLASSAAELRQLFQRLFR
jgi:hypothetical protein